MENIKEVKKTLTTSIFDVFEKMFFLFLEAEEEGKGGYDLMTSLGFAGPLNGELRLYFTEGLARAMAANMLSLAEEEVTAEMKEDCAKEAVNMIGGQFLRTLDARCVFQLALPRYEAPPSGAASFGETSGHRLFFQAEEGKLLAALELAP